MRGFEICYGTKEICKRARRKKQFKCFLRQNISRVTLIARRRVYISSVFRFWYRCLNAGLYSFVNYWCIFQGLAKTCTIRVRLVERDIGFYRTLLVYLLSAWEMMFFASTRCNTGLKHNKSKKFKLFLKLL